MTEQKDVDVLILGAGWTAEFLLPLLGKQSVTYAATTTTGRCINDTETIKFRFDPSATDPSYFSVLPNARNVLITFPLTGKGQSELLVSSYRTTHRHTSHFLQLGSSGIWQIPGQSLWVNRHSKYDKENPRAIAEDELLFTGGCVLNLSGLWGGKRQPKSWIYRIAKTKEDVANKTCVHMIHGLDVARAILAIFRQWDGEKTEGQRWMLTDGFVYDWWSLLLAWANANGSTEPGSEEGQVPTKQSVWVQELMWEKGVKALPRNIEDLGRCYDCREFWHAFRLTPLRAGLISWAV